MFAEVVLANVTKEADKIYHYSIPEELAGKIVIGSAVDIQFGRRRDVGYVVGLVERTDFPRIRPLLGLAEPLPLFDEKRLALVRWIAAHYLSFFSSALKLILPPPLAKKPRPTKEEPISQIRPETSLPPTTEQAAALKKIEAALNKKEPKKFLLHGVTGSGKTEVYLQAIAAVLKRGGRAIVLVPEISLTPQLIRRFQARFPEELAILHSGLTDKERGLIWRKITAGKFPIVLGTRLALFAPQPDLRLIILDEEYELSYKSEMNPRYHARETASELAKLCGAVLLLGSATPALESFYLSETGEYERLSLPRRIADQPLPPVEVVDLREELKHKNFSLLSRTLRQELGEVLKRGEQAILFTSRIGYYTFVLCRSCGLTIACPHCAVSLIYNSPAKNLRCGHCGYQTPLPQTCPQCLSSAIRYFGGGTQRVEDEVGKAFPDARIIRYDRDALNQKGNSHEKMFAAFADGKADILIGTRQIAKGLDLARVTLVGVISADPLLSWPDFRAGERAFQLLTQLAGRAGRHQLPGRVIIQTYNPEHYAIRLAARHDYEGFYRQELAQRQELGYPPFSFLVNLVFSGEKENEVSQAARQVRDRLLKSLPVSEVLGPVPAALPRRRALWRYQLLLKSRDLERLLQALRPELDAWPLGPVKLTVDVEPTSLL